MLIVLGTFLGFIQGVAFFVIVHFSRDAPLDTITSGELLDYPPLLFGGVGAICGAILCWALHALMKKNRVYVSVPRNRMRVGDKPYKGPFG
jgi:hypothetical protein